MTRFYCSKCDKKYYHTKLVHKPVEGNIPMDWLVCPVCGEIVEEVKEFKKTLDK